MRYQSVGSEQRASRWISDFLRTFVPKAAEKLNLFLSYVKSHEVYIYECAFRSFLLGVLGMSFFTLLSGCAGAVVFAYYSQLGCGPLESGVIYSSNQV